jgi:predicted GNAT family N-acyltransferase
MHAVTPVCRRASTPDDIAACLDIRNAVFVLGQGVDVAVERDGLDDECLHYLAETGGAPVGAARVRVLEDRFKFQRVAVLAAARGRRIGDALMRFMMTDLAARPDAAGRHFFLSSQTYAMPFYEKLGFTVCSAEFMDAGIPHHDMRTEIALP